MTGKHRSAAPHAVTFEGLDAVRGLGALVVLYGHSANFWFGDFWLRASPIAVDMFFMLSGFVIAFVYEPRFKQGMPAVDFLRQRIVRLYPLYMVGFLLGAIVWAMILFGNGRGGGWLAAFLPGVAMLPSVPMTADEPFYLMNPPAWTLFFELWVNVAYFCLFRWLTTARVALIVCAAAVVLTAMAYAYGTANIGAFWGDAPGGFARVTFGFFAGVLIYRVAGRPPQPVERRNWLALAPVACMIGLCFVPRSFNLPLWGELLCLIMVAPLLLAWSQTMQLPRITAAPLLKLGAMSYCIYIIHFPFLDLAARIDWRLDGLITGFRPLPGIVIFVAVVVVAFVIDTWLDAPMRRWLDGHLRKLQHAWQERRAATATARSSRHRLRAPRHLSGWRLRR